jgi:DNA-binding SARP family transcriptional activator/predicted RNA-binding Zn ribbon-like protein
VPCARSVDAATLLLAMEFRLLGPFEALDIERPILVGNRRQERCLLGILLLEAGRPVSTQRLMDLLWDGEPPESARGTIHTYVGRLRQSLAPYRVRISTHPDGYAVDADGHRIDAHEFVDLTRRAAAAIDPGERLNLYDRALDLWRGPLLADVAGMTLRERLETGLTELRLSAAERRADDQLAMGQHDRVVANLMPLAEPYPTRERLTALLMTALYRCARPADALRLYDLTAKVLDAELGVEPGYELRKLREQILRGDPRLDRPAGPMYAVRVRDQWLPWSVGGHPALDFCNTYAGWAGPRLPGADWLHSYATLAVWAEYMDLADEATVTRLLRVARRAPREAGAVLDAARSLRINLYTCLTKPDDGRAFSVVARFAEAAVKVSTYVLDDTGLGRWTLAPAVGLRLPLHAAAQSAAQLLGDPRRHAVCACRHDHCGWLFLDPSGRRRYCSVATCL